MDFTSLKDQVSNLTLYDLKAGVRKVQNAVMNFTEMEAKVREATNNEPWGASSTLMQEIANATFNYQLLNEIMPMIYKRFTEKAAEEWRQIYKALQLLEFLIKNGSERVIDDARSHVSLLKMLRQFHFIDQNGKDQGINVRNRAKELAELLSDVDRIRSERKKARANRNKFGGVEGGMGMGGFSSSGGFSGGSSSRYGGFGSESANADYGGYSGAVYGDGGGFGGNESGFQDTQRRGDKFEEYDEGDDVETSAPPRRTQASSTQVRRETKKEDPQPKAPEPVADLLAWDDEPAPASSAAGKQPLAASNDFGDDDFDDFQSAAPAAPAAKPAAAAFIAPPASTSTIGASTQFAAPQPQSAAQNNNLNDLFATVSPPPASNNFASPPLATPVSATSSINQPYKPSGIGGIGGKIGSGAPKKTGGDAFASLLGGSGPKKTSTPTQKVTMADMAKQKTSQGLWGAPASGSSTPASQPQSGSKPGGALGDLLG
ncbi:Epsin-3, clathrin recruitment and traffic between the Golgi and endosome [Didymosphaeria variabile]|uniref:Epsin-3, clathrin recruitment and traffic between the Golgi and endosome n=1 Tax=Didymosphaeria variabile TaxID=1932322 RepID=A0A9W8XL42_9PLEO|nr:Epsin-3, clathrin recruitment and traffic between the Golgi and endosome [Didymosphaeria variabile]KAJ4352221.1 Epsin-3, clathrin recruitment and traffic between the Golgi and endosome [Didymosphaeria variabile]